MGTKNLAKKGPTQESNNGDNNQSTGIVLNRMYTGSYLSTNLGHEVINMFQADNGRHYLYLNDKGNFDKKYKETIDDMLLVRHIGNNKIEILAWASGLTPVPGTSLPYSKFDLDGQIRKFQDAIISCKDNNLNLNGCENDWKDELKEGIMYGGANLIEIFGKASQQNIYITYRAKQFKIPVKDSRLFLQFEDEENNWEEENNGEEINIGGSHDTFYLPGYLLGKMTLHQFINNENYSINNTSWNSLIKYLTENKIESSGELEKKVTKKNTLRYKRLKIILTIKEETKQEYEKIKETIENRINNKRKNLHVKLNKWLIEKKWKESSIKIDPEVVKNYKPREVSLFDIVPKLRNDENCFSDALKYFINRDKESWQEILKGKELCNDEHIGSILSVEREKDATVGKKNDIKNTSSNENASSSSNGGRIDLLIQTDNAYIVIENKIKSDINKKKGEGDDANQLTRYRDYVRYRIIGDYISNLTTETLNNDYKEVTPKGLDKLESKVKNEYKKSNKPLPDIKSYFFILAPDYNMPNEKILQEFKYTPLPYSKLVGKEEGGVLKEYHDKHMGENLWSSFYDAMRRHSYESENDSLYEDMKNTFFTRIKELSSKDNPNA